MNNITIKNIYRAWFLGLALIIAFFVLSFGISVNTSSAASCPSSTATLDADHRFSYNVVIDSSQTTASVVVSNSSGCTIPMSLVAWKVYGNISDQSVYATTNATVGPGNTTIRVNLATCMTQVDLYYGSDGRGQETDYVMFNGPACSHNPPPPPPASLDASCSVTPSSVNVNGSLNWSSSASGGTGSYVYSWSGTDSLSGSGSSVSKVYSSTGSKVGTVTITSGSQSVVRSCSAVVNQVVNNDLSISCSASPSNVDINEDVTWRSTASGGDGSYSYNWTGTNGLSGGSRNITWSYDTNGTKHGTVTVTSAGQSASASCTAGVNEVLSDDLSVSCYASPSNPQIGSQMNWYANVSGGDGDYRYSWSGTDGLNSSSRSPYMTYYNPGSKSATVVVRDGNDQRVTRTCYANVNSVLAYSQVNQTPLASAVYLSQVPSTGLYDNFKLYFFVLMLALFSAWVAYVVTAYQKEKGILN